MSATLPVPSVPGRESLRVPGLPILAGIVLLGLGSGAAYYQYLRPRAAAELERELSQVPGTPGARLELWLHYNGPNIHHRLAEVARFSAERPWIVTHALEVEGQAELWGIDCSLLPRELARAEGLTVVVDLPRPAPLVRTDLAGEEARLVPLFSSESEVPDPAGRVADLALFFLEGLPRALERDIPGARLEVRVAAR
jgi:hypothetical protein